MHSEDRALTAPPPLREGVEDESPVSELVGQVLALGYVSGDSVARIDDPCVTGQAAAIDRFCARRGWELIGMVHDVKSRRARGAGRPALVHALERLRRGDAHALVVAELRRLCPSVAELGGVLEAIDEAGADFVSLDPRLDTGTPVGRVVARALVSVSDWERSSVDVGWLISSAGAARSARTRPATR